MMPTFKVEAGVAAQLPLITITPITRLPKIISTGGKQ